MTLLLIVLKFLIYLFGFMVFGTMLYRTTQPEVLGLLKNNEKSVILKGVLLFLLVLLGHFMIQVAILGGDDLAAIFDVELIKLLSQSATGTVLGFRVGAILLLVMGLYLPCGRILVSLAVFLYALSFTLGGHTSNESSLSISGLLVLHILGLSFWFGALLSIKMTFSDRRSNQEIANLAHRFGLAAQYVVVILVIAGLAIAWDLIQTPDSLVKTNYGLMLILKLFLVLVLISLAALNKFYLTSAMLQGKNLSFARFNHSVRVEIIVFIVILLITATLTTALELPG